MSVWIVGPRGGASARSYLRGAAPVGFTAALRHLTGEARFLPRLPSGAGSPEPRPRVHQDPISDEEIAVEIARRGLEVLYLQELAASLGFMAEEGWNEEVFAAIERASLGQRRTAALRALGRRD